MDALPLWIALAAALVGAGWDLRTRRIPNALTLSALGMGLALRAVLEGPAGLGTAVVGAFAAGFPALALFQLRAMGGGDVKLLAACGALAGPAAAVQLLLVSALAGGVLAATAVASRGAWAVTARNLLGLLVHWRIAGLTPCPEVSLGRTRGVAVPYGLAIAAGTVFVLASHLGTL